MKDPQPIHESSPSTYKSIHKKEIKQKQGLNSTEYIQLNTEQKTSNSQTLIGSFVFRNGSIYRGRGYTNFLNTSLLKLIIAFLKS